MRTACMRAAWKIPPMWKGEEVWLLGGGPSLIDSFNIPKELADDVRSKKIGIDAYSPYLAAIHDKRVIGVNAAFKLGNWVDFCFFGDKRFFLQYKYELAKFPKLVVTCDIYSANKADWIKYVPKHEDKEGISPNASCISWNYNSGGAAISLAAWLGAKRIILVGFDMTLGKDKKTHFHNEYAKPKINHKRQKPRRTKKEIPFASHLSGFPAIKTDADRMGIEIINASPISMITQFEKIEVKDLL